MPHKSRCAHSIGSTDAKTKSARRFYSSGTLCFLCEALLVVDRDTGPIVGTEWHSRQTSSVVNCGLGIIRPGITNRNRSRDFVVPNYYLVAFNFCRRPLPLLVVSRNGKAGNGVGIGGFTHQAIGVRELKANFIAVSGHRWVN